MIGPLASYSNLIGCHSQVRHYKMVGATHVSEPRNSLAKQILLDVVMGVSPAQPGNKLSEIFEKKKQCGSLS